MKLVIEGQWFGSAFSVKPWYYVGTDFTTAKIHSALVEHGIKAMVRLAGPNECADDYWRASPRTLNYRKWKWYTIEFLSEDDHNMALMVFGEP